MPVNLTKKKVASVDNARFKTWRKKECFSKEKRNSHNTYVRPQGYAQFGLVRNSKCKPNFCLHQNVTVMSESIRAVTILDFHCTVIVAKKIHSNDIITKGDGERVCNHNYQKVYTENNTINDKKGAK